METPKTAEQINAAQMGKTDLTPKPPAAPSADFITATPKPMPRPKPPGCWDLAELSGSRDGVCRAIQADPLCPQADKDWICTKIAALPAEFNHVVLHAYCHVEKGVWVFDMSMKPGTQLL